MYHSRNCRCLEQQNPPASIPVLNHALDLPPHGQEHQDQPVHHQNRPEDGQVEDLAPAAGESNADGAGGRVPELELGETAHERLELFVALGGERRGACGHAVLHVGVRFEGRVEFGRDEGEEEVEEVNSEGVSDCVRCWLVLVVLMSFVRYAQARCGLSVLDVPIYHPCANTIRRPKRMKTVAVAIQRYVVYGVDLSK